MVIVACRSLKLYGNKSSTSSLAIKRRQLLYQDEIFGANETYMIRHLGERLILGDFLERKTPISTEGCIGAGYRKGERERE